MADATIVRFVDELPSKGGPRAVLTDEIRRALMNRPGEWAFIKTYASASGAINYARRRDMPNGFESAARRCDLYARYVGPVS